MYDTCLFINTIVITFCELNMKNKFKE